MTYGWGALGFCVLAVGAGGAFAAVRALGVWRDLRALQRALGRGLAEVGGLIAAAEQRAADLPGGLDELAAAQARLSVALARARVLEAAAREAVSPLDRLRAAVPRKRL